MTEAPILKAVADLSIPSADFDACVILRDGSSARVRPIRPDDEAPLFDFLSSLSMRSRTLRFAGGLNDDSLKEQVTRQSHLDSIRNFGLVAEIGSEGQIVGHAEYAALADQRAEVAFAIGDEFQGRGLATILLGQLAQIAFAHGVRIFEATVIPENRQMISVFRECGFPVRIEPVAGEIRLEFPIEVTADALERFDRREATAAVNALHPFIRPRSVAVIGASRQRGTIGGEVLHNLLSYGLNGPVFPVNSNAAVVQSVVAYASVEDVPGLVDLAVVTVPAEHVLEVARSCARKRVRAVVVISAGFAESGQEGRVRQEELLGICRDSGMRLIGPNCMGVMNTHPKVRLNATFAPAPPSSGRIGFMSQSGALGVAVMDHASALGLGLSSFVSVGNKADISGNDLIAYWEQDVNTDLILLYLESFGNPRKFSRIARRVARRKPIVAVKSGRSTAGARAAGSHTGALIAASDVTVDALFRQAGVIRTGTLEEMFDVASLLAHQPLVQGRRVALLTNAGGPGILCADACAAEGLEVPVLTEATQAALRTLLSPAASVLNPVDMLAAATADQYRKAIGIVGRDPNVDALVAIFIPPLVTRPEDVAVAIVDGARTLGGTKPLLTVFMQSRGVPNELRSEDVRVPSYMFPENAAIALAQVARYAEWRARPVTAPARFADVRHDEAAAVIAAALGRGVEWLAPDEVWTLLSCYGLPVVEQRIAQTAEDAELAARALDGPVALKGIAPGLVHKSEAGAVLLDLLPESVASAARSMRDWLLSAGHSESAYLVQRMARSGVEMIVGVVHDPHFGPVVACGGGGVLVELLKDVAVRLTPIAADDAEEMLRELKTYPLLTGYRGGAAAHVPALVNIVQRVSAMVEDLPQIVELDLNPVVVHIDAATVLDARVRVAAAHPSPLLGARTSEARETVR